MEGTGFGFAQSCVPTLRASLDMLWTKMHRNEVLVSLLQVILFNEYRKNYENLMQPLYYP